MREMKDSGIEWIGEIPEEWKTIKFNALYDLRNQKVSDRDFPPLSVTKNGIVPQLSSAAKTNDGDNRKLVKVGDFAINSRSDRRGSCGISKYEGSVSLINTVLRPINNEMSPDYYNLLFHTFEFADEFYKWGHGIVDDLWTTNWQDMKNITLVYPSKKEQDRIASVLNKKVKQINQTSKTIQQEIDALEEYRKSLITETVTKGLDKTVPMKDSGIAWIGEIPENWKVEKLKYLVETRESKILLSDVQYNYIGLENIEKNIGKYISTDSTYENQYYNFCEKGDILYSKLRPNLSKAIIAPFAACCTGEFEVIKSTKLHKKYILYYLLSNYVTDATSAAIYGTKMPRVSWNYVKNLRVVFPNQSEDQIKIVNYLDKKLTIIDQIVRQKQQQLNHLDKYKQSIVYEYVTGKKQVSEKEGVKNAQ